MKTIYISLIILILLPSFAFSQECTKAQAQEAEAEVVGLITWDQVFEVWQLYKHCDDGAIAEGFSEAISSILSTKWTEKGHLIKLIEHKPQFGKFIIGHIDETVPVDRLANLGHMAKMRCVDATHEFCMAVLQKATVE